MTDRGSADGGLKSVLHALDLLDCFAVDEELGVSDIARRLGVAKSTAHRLLTTLCARGLTEQNPETGQYRLGLHLFELGQIAINRVRLRQAAFPLLEELRERTGDTIHLSIPDGAEVVYLERLQTLRGMQLVTPFGRRLPSHATSGGKVLAAYDPVLADARREKGFPALTDYTISNRRQYDRALDETRRLGYAASFDETTIGLGSVAAPIFDSSGHIRAALSIVDTTDRMRANAEKMARLAIHASGLLSRRAGI
jgi:DNA-binding IclR family transcriptional regulator